MSVEDDTGVDDSITVARLGIFLAGWGSFCGFGVFGVLCSCLGCLCCDWCVYCFLFLFVVLLVNYRLVSSHYSYHFHSLFSLSRTFSPYDMVQK